MDDDALNMSVRKFLKQLGVTSQREIELAIREQIESGALSGDEELEVEARVTVRGIPQETVVTGKITLG
jgi:Family of unknown function (DUF6494)